MTKKYDFNKNRKRKRFKARWVGGEDTDGFVTQDKLYSITEVKASGHYAFVNNFGQNDLAHADHFEQVTMPRLGRRK